MSKTLKDKYLAGEKIVQSRISMASTTEQVHQTIADTGCDIIYIDSQHGPYTEWDIARISEAGEEKGVPVLLRIKHTRHAYRLGNYCDLGVMAIKVPEVETEEIVDEAINSFYLPPSAEEAGADGWDMVSRREKIVWNMPNGGMRTASSDLR